jgi:hypothetical protein
MQVCSALDFLKSSITKTRPFNHYLNEPVGTAKKSPYNDRRGMTTSQVTTDAVAKGRSQQSQRQPGKLFTEGESEYAHGERYNPKYILNEKLVSQLGEQVTR